MGGGIDLPGAQRRADHLPELAQPGRHPGLLVPGGCCTVVAVRRALRSSSTSYRLSPLTLAWLSCSGVMSAPSNRAQSSRASRKFAPWRLAPARSASLRLASLRSAWLKSAALRSAAARVAPLKLAPASLALLRFALLRSALLKSAPLRSAPARLTSPRLASLKSAPFSLIAVSGCSALHMFQVVATSCFNRSNCCSFAMMISLLFSVSQKKLR